MPSPLHPPPLPPLPRIALRIARDRTAESRPTGGFLNLQRLDLVATSPDGRESRPFHYDIATRASLDAAVMAAHYVERGVRHVYLRSAVRPALGLRTQPLPPWDGDPQAAGAQGSGPLDTFDHAGAQGPGRAVGALWELPAGLIDEGETPAEAAARELEEELGFAVPASAMVALGPRVFPVPGFLAEAHYYFHVEVDPKARTTPSEDGSALEKDAVIVAVPIAEALEHCRSGDVCDAKTELLLRRLVERLT
jgi:ADP-ribose pyrophosphatase